MRTSSAMLALVASLAVAAGVSTQKAASSPASSTSTSAASNPVAAAFAAADKAQDRLEMLRWHASPRGPLIEQALQAGLAALDEVDRLLDESPAGAPAAPNAATQKEASSDRSGAVRLLQCRLALQRGLLHQAAMAALDESESHELKAQCQQKALAGFRALRIEYREQPLAYMGYVAEAATLRLAGQYDAALSTLEAVTKLSLSSVGDPTMAELYRIARLERLEVLLAQDAGRALKEATQWRSGPEIKNNVPWQLRTEWVIARARVAQAELASHTGQPLDAPALQAAAALLRQPAMIALLGAYERMQVLVQLDELNVAKLSRQEWLEWARLLGSLGRSETVAAFAKSAAASQAALAAPDELALAGVLWDQQRWKELADLAERLYQRDDLSARQRDRVSQLWVAPLLKLREQITAASQSTSDIEGRLEQALQAVLASGLDEKLRGDALRQWVLLADLRRQGEKVLAMLQAQQPLVRADAFLMYAQCLARWQALQTAASSQPIEEAQAAAQQVLQDLGQTQELAKSAGESPLAAQAVLLQVRVLASWPMHDARSALQVLTSNMALLKAQPQTGTEAPWLQVQLMLDLGMVDAAAQQVQEYSSDKSGNADVTLRLAEALAARYAAADGAGKQKLRQQVVSLCNQAMSHAVADTALFAQLRRRSSRVMLAVQAFSDARSVLGELLKEKVIQDDRVALLDCRLMSAQSWKEGGDLNASLEQLIQVAREFPDAPQVGLQRGRCLLELRQGAEAAESFRQARKLAREGSALWCQITLELADALRQQGQASAGVEILRVSRALHPDFGNPELKARLIELQGHLANSPSTMPARSEQ